MSYILEALKKSEQERNPDKVPDLSTQHQGAVTQQSKSFPWAWVITAFVLVNIIFWYLFLFQNPFGSAMQEKPIVKELAQPQEAEEVVQNKTVPNQESKQEPNPQPQVVENKPAQQETGLIGSSSTPKPEVKQNETVIQTPVIQSQTLPTNPRPAVTSGYDDLPHISELPLSLQQQIPNLSFTTHIYVRDGGSFVIINDSSLSDGMSLGSGLVLESIEKQGVILSYRNRRFTLRSMESWTTN